MVRQSVRLSDWIQYLDGIINQSYTIYIGFFSVGFTLIVSLITVVSLSLSIPQLEIIRNSIIYLFVILGVGGLLFILIGNYFKGKSNKVKKFLDKIMNSEIEIDVDEIRKEWFREDENMWSRLKQIILELCLPIGFSLFIILGLVNNYFNDIY